MDFGQNTIDKFWRKVRKCHPNHCWEWKGTRNEKHYGMFYCSGSRMFAHRFSLIQSKGAAAFEGAVVMHTCDNPPCVNPRHLNWGTHQDNVTDARLKGRRHRTTMKESHVEYIKLLLHHRVPIKQIARCYRQCPKTIRLIRDGVTWRYVKVWDCKPCASY